MKHYDAIVVGLGAFGSAAVYHLARRGASVLGIDRAHPPHQYGSTHGETRITRAAIGEGVEYSQLAIRSNSLWRELEKSLGQQLLVQCGCLLIAGRPGAAAAHEVDEFFDNVRKAGRIYNVKLEEFANGSAIHSRFPQFRTAEQEKGLLDPLGGLLFPEQCLEAHLKLAKMAGDRVEFSMNNCVKSFEEHAQGVAVTTNDGTTYHANRLLLTAGPWLPNLAGPPLKNLARVTRQVLFWFEISGEARHFDPAICPTYMWMVDRPSIVYGFPLVGDVSMGIKIAHEEDHGLVDPDTVSRTVTPEETKYTYETYVEPFFPDLGPRCIRAEVCLYTKIEKARFAIGWQPGTTRILIASPCSGHGFKHSAAIGEALAEKLISN